ncbi:ArsR/SmtB family transcription factor [Methylobacterium brachythecii]|uniref:ArsR family transcriptional regulator n=1 Tax=Methylobacterium brachythecii TaxID=1176177 RepID=A0A7W6F5M2_9HYPH|nr:helix-turn-helix transcriptional regulator [Methylobacterium brachythecii]MBB3901520.1 DNA-binding transcriptional ArsR family regulator [Methylobacterium brachythecii]GLS43090.1 ArsR family transcriptional regulator [Methylobacterium brachythecii]
MTRPAGFPILAAMTGSTFASGSAVAEVAAAIGDTARATILAVLVDGRAHTAGELAWEAGITPQTTSGHLAKLDALKLIASEKQGRHRYFRLASPEVAHAIEALMVLVSVGPVRHRPTGPRDEAMREARTCYDHLAGRIGVALSDAMVGRGHLVLEDGVGAVTEPGESFLRDFGIDLTTGRRSTRPLCRTCVDWSERRTHLAGRLGAALCTRCEELGWITRAKDSRAVTITPRGYAGLDKTFGISTPSLRAEGEAIQPSS